MESNIEKLLAAMRATSSNSPLVSILDQAAGVKRPVRKHKRYRQDIRTTRRKKAKYQKERADELREYNSGLRQMFFHVRREINRRAKQERPGNWLWKLSMGEWILMWLGCPAILVGTNVYKPAWQLRGRNVNEDVQLKRIDTSKPFEINNLMVMHLGKRISA